TAGDDGDGLPPVEGMIGDLPEIVAQHAPEEQQAQEEDQRPDPWPGQPGHALDAAISHSPVPRLRHERADGSGSGLHSSMVQGSGERTRTISKCRATRRTKPLRLQCWMCPGVLPRSPIYLPR